jgi:flagellar motility protein MotE (MotC chaperone)
MLRKLIRFGLAGVFSVAIGALAPAAFAADPDKPMQDTDKPAEQGQAAQEKAAREKAAADKAAADKATADEAAKQGADKAKQGADKAGDTAKEPFEGAVRPAD